MTGWTLCRCPVCGGPFREENRALCCAQGHSFDLSAEGYVNLLRRAKTETGDGREMVAARHRFLQAGYYACLRDALAGLAVKYAAGAARPAFIDAGCGEGYYTCGVFDALTAAGHGPAAVGFDLARPAVRLAARRRGGARFAVAGIFDMPAADACADLLFSVFAPVAAEEFRRVLRPGGRLIVAAPGPRHLFGLKERIYDSPYENEEGRFEFAGMEPGEVVRVREHIRLPDGPSVRDLFAMTPYYWHTPADGARRLDGVDALETPVEFDLHVFTRVN